MVKTDYYETRDDGIKLYRTYSDRNMKIKQEETDDVYDEAIDIENSGNKYVETDIPVSVDSTKITVEDTLELLGELGVDTDD